MNKTVRAAGAGLLVAVWLFLCVFAWVKSPSQWSESERSKLDQMPAFTVKSLADGSFMTGFSNYAVDQFPLRDSFRMLKALVQYEALQQQDNNGYFVYDGYVVKQTYPLNGPSVNYACQVMNKLYDAYLQDTDCRVYASVVPDKGYYLPGYPAMDYPLLDQRLQESLPWAEFVDITDTLELSDYYKTDTHWRQERLTDTAKALCRAMGAADPGSFTVEQADVPFYGVYYGHAALPLPPETLYMLQSGVLEKCTVTDPVTGKTLPVYDESKLQSADQYEVFLSGNQPVLRVDNPHAATDKELVLFRDSFGSAIAPLLLGSYKSVTLVDIRYITQELLGQYVTFEDQDVLFLYSTLVLNESSTMKR